jgi:hypothetical protein
MITFRYMFSNMYLITRIGGRLSLVKVYQGVNNFEMKSPLENLNSFESCNWNYTTTRNSLYQHEIQIRNQEKYCD